MIIFDIGRIVHITISRAIDSAEYVLNMYVCICMAQRGLFF